MESALNPAQFDVEKSRAEIVAIYGVRAKNAVEKEEWKGELIRVDWIDNDKRAGSMDVHKELMCFHSKFFRALCYGKYSSYEPVKVEIRSTDLVLFADFKALVEYISSPIKDCCGAKVYSVLKVADYLSCEQIVLDIERELAKELSDIVSVESTAFKSFVELTKVFHLPRLSYIIKRKLEKHQKRKEWEQNNLASIQDCISLD